MRNPGPESAECGKLCLTGWILFQSAALFLLVSTSAMVGLLGYGSAAGPDGIGDSIGLLVFSASFAYIYIGCLAYYYRTRETFQFLLVLGYILFSLFLNAAGGDQAAFWTVLIDFGPAALLFTVLRAVVDGIILLPFLIGAAVYALAPD